MEYKYLCNNHIWSLFAAHNYEKRPTSLHGTIDGILYKSIPPLITEMLAFGFSSSLKLNCNKWFQRFDFCCYLVFPSAKSSVGSDVNS